jgi:hypothetical protein
MELFKRNLNFNPIIVSKYYKVARILGSWVVFHGNYFADEHIIRLHCKETNQIVIIEGRRWITLDDTGRYRVCLFNLDHPTIKGYHFAECE